MDGNDLKRLKFSPREIQPPTIGAAEKMCHGNRVNGGAKNNITYTRIWYNFCPHVKDTNSVMGSFTGDNLYDTQSTTSAFR